MKLFCLLLLVFSTVARAEHDADERHLNGYELVFAGPDSRRIERMDGPVYRSSGSATDIAGRAHDCFIRYVSDKPNSPTSVSGVLGNQGEHSSSQDSPVIEGDDPGKGMLFAHSRAPFRHFFLAYEARSRFELDAKDGSFRIVQSDLGYRQLDTGNGSYQDFTPIQRLALTGWDSALEALQEVSEQVAACIGTSPPPANE